MKVQRLRHEAVGLEGVRGGVLAVTDHCVLSGRDVPDHEVQGNMFEEQERRDKGKCLQRSSSAVEREERPLPYRGDHPPTSVHHIGYF